MTPLEGVFFRNIPHPIFRDMTPAKGEFFRNMTPLFGVMTSWNLSCRTKWTDATKSICNSVSNAPPSPRSKPSRISTGMPPVGFDRHRVRDLFSLSFIEAKQDVLFMGSVGVGKTFLASALGHAACRAGYDVLFIRADQMFLELKQSRADYSHEKALRRFLALDLLILDDFALRRLDTTQSNDIYEVVIERHRRSSTILTSKSTRRRVDSFVR